MTTGTNQLLASIGDAIAPYKYVLLASLLAFVTATIRTMRDKSASIVEATFCVLITIGFWAILQTINQSHVLGNAKIPEILIVGIGGLISTLGSKWAQSISRTQAERVLLHKQKDNSNDL